MKYSFIYFDLDDTLLNHKQAEERALTDLYEKFSFLKAVSLDNLKTTYSSINSLLWTQYGKGEIDKIGLQQARFERTLSQLTGDGSRFQEAGDFYMKQYRNYWEWIAGAQRGYDTIRKRVDVGILTNGFGQTQKLKFEQFKLQETAKTCVISEEVGFMKPQPEVFKAATELVRRKATDILYVGDSFNSDVTGAKNFGWDVAWFTTDGDIEKRSKADFVFDDYKDLIELLN